MLLRIGALLVLVAVCAGCGQAVDQASSSTTVETTSPSTSLPVYLDEGLIGQVRALASEEAGVDPDAFEVEVAAEVTWSDGSLGCPEPGRAYTQALVDGYWVVLDHDGTTYDYRAGSEASFTRCPDGSPPASIDGER